MGRCKNWELIVYPESCDLDILKGWLSDHQLNFYLSPLHNMDVYGKYDVEQKKCGVEQLGQLKKEHYHLILCFSSMKSFAQVVDIATEIKASAFVKEVHSMCGALRYLCHLDEKDKFKYSVNNVYCRYNDYLDKIELETTNYNFIGDLYTTLKIERITEFSDLVAHYIETNNKKMLHYCQNNSYFVVSICKSMKYSKKGIDKLLNLSNNKNQHLSKEGAQAPLLDGLEIDDLTDNEDDLPDWVTGYEP